MFFFIILSNYYQFKGFLITNFTSISGFACQEIFNILLTTISLHKSCEQVIDDLIGMINNDKKFNEIVNVPEAECYQDYLDTTIPNVSIIYYPAAKFFLQPLQLGYLLSSNSVSRGCILLWWKQSDSRLNWEEHINILKAKAGRKRGGEQKTLKNCTVQYVGQRWIMAANYTTQLLQED